MLDIILSTGNVMGAVAGSINAAHKSNLELVQSLRLNISDAIQSIPPPTSNGTNGFTTRPQWKSWTSLQAASPTQALQHDTLYVPSIDFATSSLSEERPSYDITLKLFYLRSTISAADRTRYTRAAISLVLEELHMPSVDLLIVSFPGIYFDEETEDCPDKIKSRGPAPPQPAEDLDSQIATWQTALEPLVEEGLVLKLGVSEFGTERLEPFLQKTKIKPSVNQINLRDCCSVPKPLLALAKNNDLELLVHNDCTNILPRGTVRELLGQEEGGAGVLSNAASGQTAEGRAAVGGIQGEVTPQWVVKYTAVVKDRGVVENKGYFAMAEVGS